MGYDELLEQYKKNELTFTEYSDDDDLVEENKLVTKYDAVLGGAQIEFNGETLNLSTALGDSMEDDGSIKAAEDITYDPLTETMIIP